MRRDSLALSRSPSPSTPGAQDASADHAAMAPTFQHEPTNIVPHIPCMALRGVIYPQPCTVQAEEEGTMGSTSQELIQQLLQAHANCIELARSTVSCNPQPPPLTSILAIIV